MYAEDGSQRRGAMAVTDIVTEYPAALPEARRVPRPNVRAVAIALFILATAAALALVYLALASQATASVYNIRRLEQMRTTRQARVDELKAEKTALGSPRRIEAEATRLGLGPATVIEFIPGE